MERAGLLGCRLGFGAVGDAHLGVGEDDVDGWAQSRGRADLGTLGLAVRFARGGGAAGGSKSTPHISPASTSPATPQPQILLLYTTLSRAANREAASKLVVALLVVQLPREYEVNARLDVLLEHGRARRVRRD